MKKPKDPHFDERMQTIGFNSNLDKTISSFTATLRMTQGGSSIKHKSIRSKMSGVKTNYLNQMQIKQYKDPRYHQPSPLKSKVIKRTESKSAVNIMNVTFNSRPGVKEYILHLKEGEDKVPQIGRA